LVGLVAAAGGNNVVVVYVRWCVKQIFDSNVGGGEEKEGKCMFGNSCGVYWGRDVVGLPVVQLVNKFERNRFFRFFGVESCVANFLMV